ncbi:hypothetical protein GDO81_017245 [Engystomops pustulosus]|uniref:Uncharacterized protein n=1 Tax=Engystomops pustulosus TaxID=76066 RepID=A0AAV7AGR5_ENGPU|nr:hypothetical protein GDO81_017245 [Engystomops pustulosus]
MLNKMFLLIKVILDISCIYISYILSACATHALSSLITLQDVHFISYPNMCHSKLSYTPVYPLLKVK